MSRTAVAAYHPAHHAAVDNPGPPRSEGPPRRYDQRETVLSKLRSAGHRRRPEPVDSDPPTQSADSDPPAASASRADQVTKPIPPAQRLTTRAAPPLPIRPAPPSAPPVQPSPTPAARRPSAPAPQRSTTGKAGPGRRAGRRRGPDATPALPSVAEITVYTGLAAGVASAVFMVGERPGWHVGAVWVAAALIVTIVAVISRGSGRPTPLPDTLDARDTPAAPDESSLGKPTTGKDRHGRRRKR
jgi:hypothetical protein